MVERQREKQFFFNATRRNLYVIIQKPFSYNYFILIAVGKKLVKILGLTAMLRGSGPLQHPTPHPAQHGVGQGEMYSTQALVLRHQKYSP